MIVPRPEYRCAILWSFLSITTVDREWRLWMLYLKREKSGYTSVKVVAPKLCGRVGGCEKARRSWFLNSNLTFCGSFLCCFHLGLLLEFKAPRVAFTCSCLPCWLWQSLVLRVDSSIKSNQIISSCVACSSFSIHQSSCSDGFLAAKKRTKHKPLLRQRRPRLHLRPLLPTRSESAEKALGLVDICAKIATNCWKDDKKPR